MKKTRIIKRTDPCGRVNFVIQQKHYMFFWWWVDAWANSWDGAACVDSFDSLEEAKENLCRFDGTRCKETICQ